MLISPHFIPQIIGMNNSSGKESDPKDEMTASLNNANMFLDTMLTPEHLQATLVERSATLADGQSMITENSVGTVILYGVSIVSLQVNDDKRLCLAQISNTLLREFSYNEIHNRRVALGITCLQCTPIQLQILRGTGAMPVSSRRCGLITKREAERLVKSFLEEIPPPQLPENFSFRVHHKCGWGCEGLFIPSRYNSSRAKCIKCIYCGTFLSPNKFIFHYHKAPTGTYRHPDAANFNSWRRHLLLSDKDPTESLMHAWEDVKALFNGGCRRRFSTSLTRTGKTQRFEVEKNQERPSSSRINMNCPPDIFSSTRGSYDTAHSAFPQPYSSSVHSFGNMLRSLSVPFAPWWSRFYSYRQNMYHTPPNQCTTGETFENRIAEKPTFRPKYFEHSHTTHGGSNSLFISHLRKSLPEPTASTRDVRNHSIQNCCSLNETGEKFGIGKIQNNSTQKTGMSSEIDEKIAMASVCSEQNLKVIDAGSQEEHECDEANDERRSDIAANPRLVADNTAACKSVETDDEAEQDNNTITEYGNPDQQKVCVQCDDEEDCTMDRLREMILVARKVRTIAESERKGLKDMIDEKTRIASELRCEMSRRLTILKDQFRTEIDQEKRLKMFLEEKLREAHTTLSLHKLPGQFNLHSAFGPVHRN